MTDVVGRRRHARSTSRWNPTVTTVERVPVETDAIGARPFLGRVLLAAPLVALSASLLVGARAIRDVEAGLSSALLRLIGTDARAGGPRVFVATDVVPDGVVGDVPAGGAVFGGFSIAASCSVVLLLVPLLILAAGVCLAGRYERPAPLVRSIVIVAACVIVVSQVRYVAAGLLIHRLGQERGFGLAHVTLGSVISTLGLVGATAGFLWLASRPSARPS